MKRTKNVGPLILAFMGLAAVVLAVPTVIEGLAPSSFMPHGHCYFWKPNLLWLHTLSDAVILLSYLSIPAMLAFFVRERRDIPFPRVFWFFVAFIVLCGLTHGVSIITTWEPVYWAEGWIKAATALVSVATALLLVPTLPKALDLRSPTELEALNVELQATVRELEESNRKLAQARSDLEDFAHIASHDLRAPLRGISMMLAWLEEDHGEELKPDALELVQDSRGRAGRLDTMVQDLLIYARADQQERAPEPVDVRAEAEALGQLLPTDRGFALTVHGSPGAVTLQKTPWVTALRNLVSNAAKHHDRDDGTIEVTLALEDGALLATVVDDGPGIPPEHRERVFEPFKTLKPRDETEGSGMGLAFVRKAAEVHGGSVELVESEGRGCTFVLRWPVE